MQTKSKKVIPKEKETSHKEWNDLAENKMRLAERILDFADQKITFWEHTNKDLLIMDKIALLRRVMVSEYGDSKFSMGESFSSKPLFTEDDMITLKGKMFELIKKL